MHNHILFDASPLKREMLQSAAPTFFNDMNQLIIEHLILQICKITDGEFTGKYRNLTIHFLVNNATLATPRDLRKLKAITSRLAKFRKRIESARNKLIGHLDLDAAHARKSFGRASTKGWLQFWHDLQDFLTLMHRLYLRPRTDFYLNGVAQLSDAENLVKAMQESTYFRATLDEKSLTRTVADIAFNSKFYNV
jgi:hypothetical protein